MPDSTTPPGAATEAGAEYLDFALYRYEVSLPAAIAALVVFLVLSVLHVWRIYRHRAWFFTAFTVGGFFQVLGYGGRIWSHFDDQAIGGFVMQAILILVAPALYAASIYMVLGRLMRALRAEALAVVPVRWITRIFVVGDVLSFLLQAGGGGIQAAGTLAMYDAGEKVIIVGLFVQIFMFSSFVATTVVFHRRWAREEAARRTPIAWRRHLVVLYVVSAIILVRSIFRVVEYLQGNRGYLISHEVFLYVFDTLLMAITMGILLVFYIDDLDETGKARSGSVLLSSGDSGMEMARVSRPSS